MTKKKGGSPKASSTKKQAPVPFDPRSFDEIHARIAQALEGSSGSIEEVQSILNNLIGPIDALPELPARTPLGKAEKKMYEAFQSSGKRRIKLAHEALEICTDCAPAYHLLADEDAKTIQEREDLLRKAVAAAQRALGRDFDEYAGHFWGFVETRPYMRAQCALAECCWVQGKRAEAIDIYKRLLELNPNDNQGIRYLLVPAFIAENRFAEIDQLFQAYPDEPDNASFLFGKALYYFKKFGAGKKADGALQYALEYNPNVIAYMSGLTELPEEPPDRIGFGDESEAIAYVFDTAEVWAETPGALQWFANHIKEGRALVMNTPFMKQELVRQLSEQLAEEFDLDDGDVAALQAILLGGGKKQGKKSPKGKSKLSLVPKKK